jgi:hypothetical protein
MRRLIVWSLFACLLWTAPAQAVEVVLATGASAASGRGEPVRAAYAFALRDLLPTPDGEATPRLGWELAGQPRLLLDARTRGSMTAGVFVTPSRSTRLGVGVVAHRSAVATAQEAFASLRAGFELGGGFVLPLGPGAGLDFAARYAFLADRPSGPAPHRFAERFWTATAGVAFTL